MGGLPSTYENEMEFDESNLYPDTGLPPNEATDDSKQLGIPNVLENTDDSVIPHAQYESSRIDTQPQISMQQEQYSYQIQNSAIQKYLPDNTQSEYWYDFQNDDEEFYSVNEPEVSINSKESYDEKYIPIDESMVTPEAIADSLKEYPPYDPGNLELYDPVSNPGMFKVAQDLPTQSQLYKQAAATTYSDLMSGATSLWEQAKQYAGTASTITKVAGGAAVAAGVVVGVSAIGGKRDRPVEVHVHTDPAKDEEQKMKIQKQNDLLEQLVKQGMK